MGKESAQQGDLKQCFAGQIIDPASGADADQRGIKVALVIGGENHRPLFQHPFGMHYAEAEEELGRYL